MTVTIPEETTALSELGQAALAYAARGWPVFPLSPGSKVPFKGSDGFKSATTDLEQVRSWWTEHPDANIGFAAGSVAEILDVDGIEGADALEEWAGASVLGEKAIPDGPRSITGGGGIHYYVRPFAGRNRAGMLPSVDFRGDSKGYSILPPSVTDDQYRWIVSPDEADIPEPSEPLRELVIGSTTTAPAMSITERLQCRSRANETLPTGGYGETALGRELDDLSRARRGERNARLNHAAFAIAQLVHAGVLDEGSAVDGLQATARSVGLPDDEIKRTILSAWDGAARNPRPPSRLPDKAAPLPTRPAVASPTSATETTDDDWPEPSPLESVSVLPPFPVDALPEWMGRYVTGLSEEKQVAPDLAGLLGLAVLGATVGGYVFADVRQGWTPEPTNLYALVALPSGERKSPVVSELTTPLAILQDEMQQDARDAIARAESDARAAKRAADEAERLASKGGTPTERITNQGLMHEAAEEAARLAETVPVRPRLLVGDITPEQLAALLAAQQGRLGLFSAEGGVFESMAGRYDSNRGKGPAKASLDIWLQAYSGERVTVDRKGDAAPILVERACLTIGIAVQPSVLSGLAHIPGFKSRGLLGRFLMAIPESKLGHRNLTPEPCDPALKLMWTDRVIELGRKVRNQDRTVTLPFEHDASGQLLAFAQTIEPRLAPGGDFAVMAEWAGKLTGQVARLAALIHLAETGPEGLDQPVSSDAVHRAIRLGEYLIPHSFAAHDLMGADPELGNARRALATIRRNGWDTVQPRDLQRADRTIRNAEEAKAALELLTDYDWLRLVDPKRGGTWEVHPAARG